MFRSIKELLGISTDPDPVIEGGNDVTKHKLYSLEFNNLSNNNKMKVFDKLTSPNNYPDVNNLRKKFAELDLDYKYDLLEFNVESIGDTGGPLGADLNDILENNHDRVTIPPNSNTYIVLGDNLLKQSVFVSENSLLFYIDNRTNKIEKLNVVDRRNKKHIFITNQDLIKDNLLSGKAGLIGNKKKIFGIFQKPIQFSKDEDYYIVPAFVNYRSLRDKKMSNLFKEENNKYSTSLSLKTSGKIILPETNKKIIVSSNNDYILPLVNQDKNNEKFNIKYTFLNYGNNNFNISLPNTKKIFDSKTIYEGVFIKYIDKPELNNVICREIIRDSENKNKIIKIKSSISRSLKGSKIIINDQEYYIQQNHYYITITKPSIVNISTKANYFVNNNNNIVNCVLKQTNPNIWYIY